MRDAPLTPVSPVSSPIVAAVEALLALPNLAALGRDAEAVLRRLQVLARLDSTIPVTVRGTATACAISESAAGRHLLALQRTGLARRVVGGYVMGGEVAPAPRARRPVSAAPPARYPHEAVRAPCRCDRRFVTRDEDGDERCGHCGRAIQPRTHEAVIA